MDILRDIFRSIRLDGSVFFSSQLTSPWSLPLDPSDQPRFHLVVEGSTWVESPAWSTPRKLYAGNLLFMNGGGSHCLADHPKILDANETHQPAECRLICGTFGFDHTMIHPLIETLPPIALFSIAEQQQELWSMIQLMANELDCEQSGSTAIVDRVCEILLIYLLRQHAKTNTDKPGFMAALGDPVIERGLKAIHEHFGRQWTLDSLASAAGLSRSAFASRFTRLVGVPPMAYLTTWRMHTAQSLLQNPSARVAVVARHVGYVSESAFARAFRQFFGRSPGAVRVEARKQYLASANIT